ncbi:UDP-N-acetylmuramoyl-L-alanyl-D-glutamate--2,6-diaminopimelate ligase [Candidatus Uhrbacteria bacterium]|nr:UDP-N-acetylmuramoyl-L-alanyl-D-glutamate--2,6-diaminopimelate ligase [Candidatus Uhrbacteria bacterium]
MLNLLRKIIPRSWLRAYHKALALLAASWYRHPSNALIVIGVTGTNGKSTTVNLIAEILRCSGVKVGLTSTVNFRVGERLWLNDQKMTMLGRFQLQKLLRQMVTAGCRYAVIETSSEGIAQFRHLGINYDVAVFLNLTPEHIESHGSFEKYKAAKGELFAHLTRRPKKRLQGQVIPKVSVVNLVSPYASYFLQFPADQKIGFSEKGVIMEGVDQMISSREVRVTLEGICFKAGEELFSLPLLGGWNVENALAAIAVGTVFQISPRQMIEALAGVRGIPGRMERIDEGHDFTVIVDYAPQPQAIERVYDFLRLIPRGRLIHLLGSAGGGRDKSRRPILGRLAGEQADIVVVTNEDPYDDDPMEIINQVAAGALEKGKQDGLNLFRLLDRREAIRKAISLARPGDLVMLTGKGAEQAIVVANRKKIPWDEREEVRRAIKTLRQV